MKIKDLGEFGLIHRIARFLPSRAPGVVVGIGDDVAVLDTGGEEYLLATCDIQVEGVHFVSRAISARQLGRRVAAINVSDIAAMGGHPSWALVSLALTPETDVVFVDGLYEGMREQLGEAGAVVVGGNLSKTAPRRHMSITVPVAILLRFPPTTTAPASPSCSRMPSYSPSTNTTSV
ncbi:MAG: hypothetical protein HGA84_03115, partial [Syntrophobacteraceae bacterium]|nr:hypothetical protein [Syntrophobacteraceae bacterium]